MSAKKPPTEDRSAFPPLVAYKATRWPPMQIWSLAVSVGNSRRPWRFWEPLCPSLCVRCAVPSGKHVPIHPANDIEAVWGCTHPHVGRRVNQRVGLLLRERMGGWGRGVGQEWKGRKRGAARAFEGHDENGRMRMAWTVGHACWLLLSYERYEERLPGGGLWWLVVPRGSMGRFGEGR